MPLHYMQLPREVIVGTNVIESLGEVCQKLGFARSALVVTGPRMMALAQEDITRSLQEAMFSVRYFTVEDATIEYVEMAEDEIDKDQPSIVIGLGGGKDIDIAKLSSARRKIPFISVPTTASHDGIASSHASIKGLDKPYSLRGQAPLAILADISIIAKSPYRLIASGCGDILSKYTAVKDWRLAHKIKDEYYGDYAAELALMSARLVTRNASAIKHLGEGAVRTVVEALISCGVAISIAGSSRPCSGSEHMFSHALTMIAPKPALHGEQCGVGAIMSAYLQKGNWKLIREVLRKIGAPTNSDELDIDEKYVVEALTMVPKVRPERYTVFGEESLTVYQAEKLARRSRVIS